MVERATRVTAVVVWTWREPVYCCTLESSSLVIVSTEKLEKVRLYWMGYCNEPH